VLVAVWMTVLLPQPSLAQEKEVDLLLTLFSGSHSYYYEATAGKDNIFYLEIRNIGSRALRNIRLSSDKPEGWVIDFEPQKLEYIDPSSLRTVLVNIKPPNSASKREYGVTIIAEANEIRKVESTRVTVKAVSLWPWIGAGVVLVIAAAFIFIFMHFGRQK